MNWIVGMYEYVIGFFEQITLIILGRSATWTDIAIALVIFTLPLYLLWRVIKSLYWSLRMRTRRISRRRKKQWDKTRDRILENTEKTIQENIKWKQEQLKKS